MAPAASATGIMGGGAATPVSRGAGFNWRSMVRYTAGLPRGLRGLGQVCASPCLDGSGNCCDDAGTTVLGAGGGTTTTNSVVGSAVTQALNIGGQIAGYELNPLYQKQTYMTTPQGLVYASNIGTGPGVSATTNIGSFLPILLIGGMVLMFMGKR